MKARVDLLLLAFGLAALVGIWITGMLVDRMLRKLVQVSLVAFGIVALALGLFDTSAVLVAVGVILWGLSFGGAATQLQTASADAAGAGVDLANAMVTTIWNTAIATGGIVGGLLLDAHGPTAFPWAVLALIIAAFIMATAAHRHGFTPGPRATA